MQNKVDVNYLKAQGFSDARIKKLIDARARRGVKLNKIRKKRAAETETFSERYVPIFPNVSRRHRAAFIPMNKPPVTEKTKKVDK